MERNTPKVVAITINKILSLFSELVDDSGEDSKEDCEEGGDDGEKIVANGEGEGEKEGEGEGDGDGDGDGVGDRATSKSNVVKFPFPRSCVGAPAAP